METADGSRVARLIELIARKLQEEIPVGADTLFFAESTYGLSGDEIGAALADAAFEGRTALLQLLFHPWAELRMEIEPYLDDGPLTGRDSGRLAAGLVRRVARVRFAVAGLPAPLRFAPTPAELTFLVDKLYLGRIVDAGLSALLATRLSPAGALRARIHLRLRPERPNADQIEILQRFVSACHASEERFLDLFEGLVALLAGMGGEAPLPEFLAARRQELIRELKDIGSFRRKLHHYPMEYLMLQRHPVPSRSEEELLRQLSLLAAITAALVDPGEEAQPARGPLDLGEFDPRTDLDAIIRLLS